MSRRTALVIGGSNGIGLAIVMRLLEQKYDKVYIVDMYEPVLSNKIEDTLKIEYIKFNLLEDDYSIFDRFNNIDTLIITAGFGRVAAFENLVEQEIINNFKVNTLAKIRIIKRFYDRLSSDEEFNCLIIGSIAGFISSPLFSVYGATKAALCKFIESINIELEMKGSKNRILNVSPGSIKGTKFNGGDNDIEVIFDLANNIIDKMNKKETIFIPEYEKTYKTVIERYNSDPQKFGIESYNYKIKNRLLKWNI